MRDRLLRISEAAPRLGYSRSSLYRLIRSGHIPVVRIGDGTALRVRESDLDRIIADRANEQVPA